MTGGIPISPFKARKAAFCPGSPLRRGNFPAVGWLFSSACGRMAAERSDVYA